MSTINDGLRVHILRISRYQREADRLTPKGYLQRESGVGF